MTKNILFIFNHYPGIGGTESVSNNVFEYLESKFNIFTLSHTEDDKAVVPQAVKKIFHFTDFSNKQLSINQINEIIATENIDFVINQGLGIYISQLIFNENRDKNVKIFSFLHYQPLAEREMFWTLPMSRFKYWKRRIMHTLGVGGGYEKCIRRFKQNYAMATIEGTKMVLLCEKYIDTFVKNYDLEPYREKVTAIENPLPRKYTDVVPVEWSERENTVLFVGRLAGEKRVDVLLDVWKNAALDHSWKLVIVGDGVDGVKLKKIVEKQSIKNVDFVGRTTTPEQYYRNAKIVMLTSATEGFPMCLIEAQRYGVVPLVFDVSDGVRSILEDGGGVLVGRNDRVAMIDKLKQMTSDDSELNNLSEQARVKSDKYTIDRVGLHWIKLFGE